MRYRLFTLALICLSAIEMAANNCHYIYFVNGNVMAYPKEYVKSLTTDNNACAVTLINDSIIEWKSSEIDSISSVKPDYPQFTGVEFNDKHNKQLFEDVEAAIASDKVTATVGAIGKWLTPTFTLDSDDGIAYVNGIRQESEQSRLRFANPVVYTLSRPGHQRLAMKKVNSGETKVSEIPLTTSMLSTNAPTSQEGEGLDMMLDGNTSTLFHSTWSADKVYEVDLNKQVYVAIALPKAVSDIQFHYVGRTGTNRYNIFEWKIEASNDGKQWKEITIINESNGLPTEGEGVAYTSPTIALGAPYSHLRFTAVKVGYKNYLCISELKLFEVTTSESTYAFGMMPLGREVPVEINWLTDKATSVPRIDINIDGGQMVSSKEYYLNALIKIQGFGIWPDFEDSVQIKGRGNTSWSDDPYAKNPYRLKFDSSVKPFGMKKGKNWNLIAQSQKGSMMTNPMAMKIARMVGTAAANDVIPVDLYMNGSYRGSYIFTQKVGLANNSVDIDETAAVLLELDHYYDETYKFKSTKYSLPVNIKDPDFSEGETMLTFEQAQNDFNAFATAVYNNSHFERFIDIDKLTRFMFVNELVLNTELGHPKSVFLYRENLNHIASSYTFGPVWDFDWSYNYEENRTYCTSGATNNILNYQTSRPGCKFFTKLWNSSPWVKHEYGRLWSSFTDDHLQELIDYVDDYYAFANSSFKKNATKWSDGANYDSNVANMKQWLKTRALYLSSIYSNPSTTTPYTFSDVDGDGMIGESDLQNVINHLLDGKQTDSKTADIDANGSVTISDVAWMSHLVQRYHDNAQHDMEIPQTVFNSGNNMAEGVSVSFSSGESAGTWLMTVSMNNNTPVIAMSMNINLPEGITAGDAMGSERMPFHNIVCGGNSSRVVAYSPNNAYISGNSGGLFSIMLTADGNISKGNYPVSITDIQLVTGNAAEQQLADAKAMLYVSDTAIRDIAGEPCQITYYTTDGKKLHKPQSGIIICRKVYPDGRVEMKKIMR